MGLVLQLSRFPWGEDAAGPARWLAAVAHAAAEAGLQGIALMDHLIQIPQIGSAWEPIPEQWVTVRVGGVAFNADGQVSGLLILTPTSLADQDRSC
jgi:hypothetical protein